MILPLRTPNRKLVTGPVILSITVSLYVVAAVDRQHKGRVSVASRAYPARFALVKTFAEILPH